MEAQMRVVEQIDLEPIMVKLMDERDGEGWSLEKAQAMAEEYRRFLIICLKYPNRTIVPHGDLDTFWHYHILDTQKYAVDCQQIFGYFLHHFPYLGMRGPEDAQQLQRSFTETQALFQEEFGVAYGVSTGATSCSGNPCGNTCHNRRVGEADESPEVIHALMVLERPRLATL